MTIGSDAPQLEEYGARDLCGYLRKLYGVCTAPSEKVAADAEVAILIGSTKTNPNVAKALGSDTWPEVSDQRYDDQRNRIIR